MTITHEKFDIFLRDGATFDMFERLDTWTSLTIIMRFNEVGTWNLEIPKSSQLARWMSPNIGIVVKFENVTIFSGSAIGEYEETKNTIKIAGKDDNFLLVSTARPTPSTAEAPYLDEYDVTTGVASTIMRSLVDRNIGPTAPTQWKIPQLILGTDPLLGSAITCRARFDPIITLLKELASTPIATGLGFRVLQSETTPFKTEFKIYEPRDKHLDTVFSVELQTAKDYVRKHQSPEANWFIVGGGDDFGPNRTIVEGGDDTSINAIGRRIPMFVDKRGVQSVGELNQELAELIAGTVTVDSITITPMDLPLLRFPTDYNLGDYVTAVVEGITYLRLIREIEIQFDPIKGAMILPTIADPSASNDSTLTRHLDTLTNRISNIERNWNVPDNSIIGDMLHDTMRWEVGDIKTIARSASQLGWLLCVGTAVNRTTYSQLFNIIGTQFGVGDGSTTFNIPDMRNRFPVGAGGDYSVGEFGGSPTSEVGSHTHTHSHGGGTLHYAHRHSSQAHAHDGSHSHGPGDLVITHTHQVDINHDHPSFESGDRNNTSPGGLFRWNEPNISSGTEDHHHDIDVPALGTNTKTSASGVITARSGNTDPDTNAPAANYSGNPSLQSEEVPAWSGGTDPDSATPTGTPTMSILNPYLGINFQIYTGVE